MPSTGIFTIPYSIDVPVNISRPVVTTGYTLDNVYYISGYTGSATGPNGNSRTGLLKYTNFQQFVLDWPTSDNAEIFAAGQAFFAQAGRGSTFYLYGLSTASATGQAYVDEALEATFAAKESAFGLCLGVALRTIAIQNALADYVEASTDWPYVFFASTSDATWKTTVPVAGTAPVNTMPIAQYAYYKQYKNTCVIYQDDDTQMAQVAYATIATGSMPSASLTMKFKSAVGVIPADLTYTDIVAHMEPWRINAYINVGKDFAYFREGTQSASGWYTDSVINIANLKVDIQEAVLRLFMQVGKVPYTSTGVAMIDTAVTTVLNQYINNGVLAPREQVDSVGAMSIAPAYSINFDPLSSVSLADRARRKAPTCTIICYEAGAIHSVQFNVEVVA